MILVPPPPLVVNTLLRNIKDRFTLRPKNPLKEPGQVEMFNIQYITLLQPNKIKMVVFFLNLEKMTCPVYATLHPYTGKVTFYKVPESHGHVKLVSLYNSDIHFFLIKKGGPIETSKFSYCNLSKNWTQR